MQSDPGFSGARGRGRATRPRVLAQRLGCLGFAWIVMSCGGGGSGGGYLVGDVHLLTTSVAPAVSGDDYSFTFTASVPHPPAAFSVTGGAIPPGLVLDRDSGLFHGVPLTGGSYSFEVGARDGPDPHVPPGGNQTLVEDRKRFVIAVTKGLPRLLTHVLPAANYRSAYAATLRAAGGTAPYRFLDASTPPDGLPPDVSLSMDGVVAGFPQTKESIGRTYRATVRLVDADGTTDTRDLPLYVALKPLIVETPSVLPPAAAAFPYSKTLRLASPGGGAPHTWAQVAPAPGETLLSDVDMEITTDGVVENAAGSVGPRKDASGAFAPPYAIAFTVVVTDEAGQSIPGRAFRLAVDAGPVLTAITPNRVGLPGSYYATGLNFQAGAVVTVAPGPSQQVITTTLVDPTRLRLDSVPIAVPGLAGYVPVKVRNPDGGEFTLARGFVLPAAGLSFGAKGFIASGLSTTGLDAADADGDGLADVVHCGAAGITNYPYGSVPNPGSPPWPPLTRTAGGVTSTQGGLLYHHNRGGSPPTFDTRVLEAGNFYDVKFGDVNADGYPDIVALTATAVSVWLNGVGGDAPGTFSRGPVSPLPSLPTPTVPLGATLSPVTTPFPSEMSLGKIDGDGILDLVFGANYYTSANGQVYSMSGDGAGGFRMLDAAVGTVTGTYGVQSLVCLDADGDGRDDVFAGAGFNYTGGGAADLSVTRASDGLFGPWNVMYPYFIWAVPPYLVGWGCTTGVAAGDFMGTGEPAALALFQWDDFVVGGYCSQQPWACFPIPHVILFHGTGLTQITTLPLSGAYGKCFAAIDADFDAPIDVLLSTNPGHLRAYRMSTQTEAQKLDVTSGAPLVTRAHTGRVASGDLDGDGKPDALVATSYWAVEYKPTAYSGQWTMDLAGDGSPMGIVFYLNASN